jgi:amidase
VGPLCKTVSDCAFVLSVLAGKDVNNDNYTSAQPFNTPPDYMKSLNLSGLAGKRLGVPWNMLDMGFDEFMVSSKQLEFIRGAFNQSIKIIEEAGAVVVSANYSFLGATKEDFQKWVSSNGTIIFQADMLQSINDYLDNLEVRAPGITTIEDLVNCTKHDPRERYPEVDIGLWDRMIKNNYSTGSETTWRAYQNGINLAGEGAVLGALRDFDLDALILPSFAAYDLPSKIGSPLVTVPMGVFDDSVDETWDFMHVRRFNAVSLFERLNAG